MAHAGTMDLGQTTKAARGGNPWMVVAVIVAIMAATVGAYWFTSGSGLTTSGALVARPAADNGYEQIEKLRITAGRGPLVDDSYDRIEAQRGAIVASGLTLQQVEQLRYGTTLAVTAKSGTLSALTLQRVAALRIAAGNGPLAFDTAGTARKNGAASSATSGTFHAGTAVAAPRLSTEQVEQLRNGDTLVFSVKSGLVIDGDHAYDPIENLRGGGAIVSDHTYDPIEQLRLGGAAVTAPASAAAVVIGPGDYSFQQLQQMAVKRDRVGGP
jgi:hypothetical protein